MILVTGGSGFVGLHVVEALAAAGHEVRVLDSLRAHPGKAPAMPDGVEFIRGDVRDRAAVADALRGVEQVSHQAGMVGLGTSFDEVADYVSHNDTGTAVLLRELASRRFSGRLILASSMVVYGEGRYECSEHALVAPGPRLAADLEAARFEPLCPACGRELIARPVPESAALDPRNVYAATKVHQEHLCAAYARETGASVVMLRYHNVYGPRMPAGTPYAGVASLFAAALAAGRAPLVFEDGGQQRDFVHVRDVAQANLAALAGDADGAFNIASGEPRSVGEMADALADATGGPRPRVTGSFRLGDVRHVFASAERAERELGFRAEESFADGMREFAALGSPAPPGQARRAEEA
ncbi:MAG: NAD-dependent epimerase/dehydratase family protein [Solirubrobacteraceae bacterium]